MFGKQWIYLVYVLLWGRSPGDRKESDMTGQLKNNNNNNNNGLLLFVIVTPSFSPQYWVLLCVKTMLHA